MTSSSSLLYKDMTSDQRQAAYWDIVEAAQISMGCFGGPVRNSRFGQSSLKTADFIKRVAKSRGDVWAR